MTTLLRDTGTGVPPGDAAVAAQPGLAGDHDDAADPLHRAVRAAARAAVRPAGSGNAYQIFVPGILVQLGIFGSLFVGFGLIAEYRAGVIESQRVTPASRTALLLGRVLRDVVVLLVQGTLLVLVSIPLGLRARSGHRPHAARGRAAGGGVRVDLLRAGAHAEE